MFSNTSGHAQIARMRSDGSDPQQLSFDERVNWFPVRRYDLDVQFEAHRHELDKIKSLVA